MRRAVRLLLAAMIAVGLQGELVRAQEQFEITEFTVDPDALCDIRDEWTEQLLATHEPGTGAKMKFEATDAQFSRMGLPSREVLSSRRYARPTLVTKDGRFFDVPTKALEGAMAGSGAAAEPTVASFAGAGVWGSDRGRCSFSSAVTASDGARCLTSMGARGATTSAPPATAGGPATRRRSSRTGNRGDATGVILLDFGTFATSHDGGLATTGRSSTSTPRTRASSLPRCASGAARAACTRTPARSSASISRTTASYLRSRSHPIRLWLRRSSTTGMEPVSVPEGPRAREKRSRGERRTSCSSERSRRRLRLGCEHAPWRYRRGEHGSGRDHDPPLDRPAHGPGAWDHGRHPGDAGCRGRLPTVRSFLTRPPCPACPKS
jgi:hypothetical protein